MLSPILLQARGTIMKMVLDIVLLMSPLTLLIELLVEPLLWENVTVTTKNCHLKISFYKF